MARSRARAPFTYTRRSRMIHRAVVLAALTVVPFVPVAGARPSGPVRPPSGEGRGHRSSRDPHPTAACRGRPSKKVRALYFTTIRSRLRSPKSAAIAVHLADVVRLLERTVRFGKLDDFSATLRPRRRASSTTHVGGGCDRGMIGDRGPSPDGGRTGPARSRRRPRERTAQQ